MIKTHTFNKTSDLSEAADISGDVGRDKVVGQAAPTIEILAPDEGEIFNISLRKGQAAKLSFNAAAASPVIEGNNFVLTFDRNGDGSADSRIVFQNLVQVSQGEGAPVLVIGGVEFSAGLLIGQAQALTEGGTLETAAGADGGPVGGGGSTYDDDFGGTLASLIAQGRLAGSTERQSEEGLSFNEDDIFFNPGPNAIDDTDSVLEDSLLPATGNVVTGFDDISGDSNTTDGKADILGGDGFGGITWANAIGGTTVVGLYGTMIVDDKGNYSYQLDDNNPLVDGLNVGDSLIEEFSYTLRDGSGDTTIAKLSLTINGSNDAPILSDNSVLVDEIQANTEPVNNQSSPSVTGLSDGGWVVTWSSSGQDGSGSGVFGQGYNANGTKQGDEFQINSYTSGTQSIPSVAALTDGGWVVTWQSYGQDGSKYGVFGQAYNADSTKKDNEFQVNTYFSRSQNEASVTGLADGGWIVTWHSSRQDGSGYGVYGQAFNADGIPQGNEFQVNSATKYFQWKPSVTGLSDGGWIVTWESSGEIYGQAYNLDGTAQGSEFHINSYTDKSQSGSSVTGLTDGGWVVTWHSYGQDQSGFGIVAKVYNSDGTERGEEFLVNSHIDGWQTSSSVTALADGGWVVTWVSDGQDGSSYGVFGQAYNADGSRQGGEFQVNSYTTGLQFQPSVTALADGGWVITWTSYGQDGSGYGIYSKTYNADGTVRSYYDPGTGQKYYAYTEGEEALIVFADLGVSDVDDSALSLAIVTITDFVAGDELGLVAGYILPADITMDWDVTTGTLILSGGASLADYEAALEHVTYSTTSDNPNVYGTDPTRTITVQINDGQDNSNVISKNIAVIGINDAPILEEKALLSEEVRINTETSADQNDASVTNLSDGGWVVTWVSYGQDGSAHGIFGQAYNADGSRFGGEFQINTETYAPQLSPSVSALSGGGWIVVWESMTNFTDYTFDILGQAYKADGSKQDGEFLINTHINQDQTEPSVSGLADGGWIVTWMSDSQDGSGYGVYAQAYNADGTPKGGEFQVSTETTGSQSLSTVIGLSNGGWIITWTDQGFGRSAEDVYARVYNAAGEPQGQEFLINSEVEGIQSSPALTSLSSGGWVITWESFGQDGDGTGIYGQAYNADGTKQGREFQVNSITDGSQLVSSVTGLSDGGWVVTWHSVGIDGYSVYGQAYNADGTKQGGEFQVNSFSNGSQLNSSVTSLSDGGWIVTWTSFGEDGSGDGIYSKTYNADGTVRSYYDQGTGQKNYTFIEGEEPLVVFTDLGLSDVDDMTLSSAVVTVTDYVAGDVLGLVAGYSLPNGMTLNWDAGAGVLRLTGVASHADYETALEQVVYSSISDNPDGYGTTPTRNLSLSINDGQDDSNQVRKTITVIDTNDTAVITDNSAHALTYTEDDPAVRLFTDLTLSDVDDLNLSSATVSITDFVAGDVLGLAAGYILPTGMTFSWDAATGALSLSGTASLGEYEAALENVVYRSISDNPDSYGVAPTRSLSLIVNDGKDNSNAISKVITVIDTNDASHITDNSGLGGAFTENGPALSVYTDLSLSDVDDLNLSSATVTITDFVAGDVLGLAAGYILPTGMTFSWDAATGALSLSGTASLGEYEAALENVVYRSISDNPDSYGVAPTRSLSLTVNDGKDNSNAISKVITVIDDNDGPVLTDNSVVVEETRLYSDITDQQYKGVVAGLPDGGWVVIWKDLSEPITEETSWGQVFHSDGSEKGEIFEVVSGTSLSDSLVVTGLKYGGWVVVWDPVGFVGTPPGPVWPVRNLHGQRYQADGTKMGDEFQIKVDEVRGYLDGSPYNPSVTSLDNGGWVVTWGHHSETRSGGDIYGQAYNADGTKLGDEFVVNEPTGSQSFSDVTALTDNGWIVVWTGGDDISGANIYGQVYNADGTKQDNQFQINTIIYGQENGAEVIGLQNGGWLVTWKSGNVINGNVDVYGQVYNADGTRQGEGFQVNSYVGAGDPDITVLADGGWVITWAAKNPIILIESDYNVHAKVYNADGTVRVEEWVLNNDWWLGDQFSPSVTSLTDGGWVVTWLSITDSARQIYTKTFNADGTVRPVGQSFIEGGNDNHLFTDLSISDVDDLTMTAATVSITDFVVGDVLGLAAGYSQPTGIALNWDAATGVLNLSGTASHAVYEAILENMVFSSISDNPDGYGAIPTRTVTVQVSDGQDNSNSISKTIAVIASNDAPVLTDVTIVIDEIQANTEIDGFQSSSSVTGLPNGGWVVTWQSPDSSIYGVYGQAYHADGSPQGVEFRVNTTTKNDEFEPSVVGLSDGGWVVTWASDEQNGDGYDIYGQAYNTTGSTQGAEFRVNTETVNDQTRASVTALSDGGWVVTWESRYQDGSDHGVYGQAYHANGTVQGNEFRVNTETGGDQWASSLAGLTDGGWVITWSSNGGIFGQVFYTDGTKQGVEFQVAEVGGNSSITGLSDGGWVVTWQSNDGNGPDIYSTTFNSDGSIRSYYNPGTGQKYHAYSEGSEALSVYPDLNVSDVDDIGSSPLC
ncbi:VCBS domain-containing protein [Kiloniella sp.]|uniref:VCBS domain-containing protein n=1 Tax=Kiloniella sp. TaxID=1938587 RepID=UPI003B029195